MDCFFWGRNISFLNRCLDCIILENSFLKQFGIVVEREGSEVILPGHESQISQLLFDFGRAI